MVSMDANISQGFTDFSHGKFSGNFPHVSEDFSHGRVYPSPSQTLVKNQIFHGVFLWVSAGVLMPISIILIRMSKVAREQGRTRKLKFFYNFHVITMAFAVITGSIGAIPSLITFDNLFNRFHQQAGLAFYFIIWLQPVIGFFRPQRGMKSRPAWYFVHWVMGTGGAFLGIASMYSGFKSYEYFNGGKLTIYYLIFSIEVGIFTMSYLFQDRWSYFREQGYAKPKPVTPLDDVGDEFGEGIRKE